LVSQVDVCALERQLLDPEVRRDRAAVDRLLHPEFVEFGASGRVWNRASILAHLSDDPGSPPAVSELTAQWLTGGAMLVTYRAERRDGTASLRASVWVREGDRWRIRFHQGTPTTAQRTRRRD
jgi:ribonuclease HI